MSHNEDAACLSEAEARALVERIADEHGYVSEDVLQTMTPEARRAVERAFHKKDAMIGSSVITLSKNLYTSPARFVFEMLQNADDNSFSRARSRNEEPFVKFNVAPRYITVECNEDGFTPKNLSAICSIGKSSKTGAQGYIGEKGIGFKSVFMAAYKVHIQSENFSFSFLHRRGDSGIGMISPIWEEWENRPATGITRIKLFLIDNLDVGAETTEHPIMQQFREIQETYLLFMKNICCVKVNFVDDSESIISAATYSIRCSSSNQNRASLVRQENHGSERINNYHVTRHLACGLPRNENREYSDAEQAVQSWSSSEVVLAFPLNDDGCAPEEVTSQQVFAFLPIRNMGFKFLIQADFVTQANRQDIVTSSARNQALRDGIADAFAEAMKQLCTDELLRYTWIRYLPVMNDYPWDEYWTGLFDRIKRKVQATPLMHSITENFPYKIGQMRKSRPSDADSNGDPIFKNISPERYLSRRYLKSELDKIHNHYGLKLMEYSEILMRASEDLNTPNSRMKSIATDDEWHEKAARLLSCAFVENEELRQTIAELDVIPLENGQWARARRAPYQLSFPSTDDGLQIPRDLPLSIISSSASEGPFRSQLYSLLGATRPSASWVRELIFNKYSTITKQNFAFGRSDRPEEISIGHLEFLYHTDGPRPVDIKKYQHMAVITEENYLVTPWSTDVYISSDHPYGAKKLLRPASNATTPECEPQGFPAHFLLSKYVVMPSHEKLVDDTESEADIRSTEAWFDWLQTRIGIRAHLKLFDGDGFSDMFQYIIDNRREDILGLLQYQWPMIQEYISSRPWIKKNIADIEVPCNRGQDFCSLSRTYLPLPELKARFSQYAENESDFRFLNFDNTLAPDDLSAWTFLSDHFGVGNSDTLSFYLDVLVTTSCDKSAPTRKVFDLYQIIYGKVISSDDVESGRGIVRSFFEDNALVMLPTTEGQKWEYDDYCRWDAPRNMRSISGLEAYYSPMYEENPALKSTLAPFMREIVGVQGLSWTDIVYELDRQKADDGNWDEEVIRQMYQLLADLKPDLTEEDQIQVKETFSSRALILAAGSWHTTDACIWSSATYIPGKATLNTDWPSLKMFFVHFLGVPTLTLNMVYKELQRKGASEITSISEMKQELWQFNSLLSVSQEKLSAEPILSSRVFPVRSPDGSVALLSVASNDFAIVDRKALGLRFNELAKLLDFTFDEVHRLQPFLAWAGLDERRLSVRVAEVTAPVVSAHLLRESKLQIQPRAYALCRIAAHLRSPKAQNPEKFYQLLLNSTVLETDEIKSELHLPEDDRILKVEQFQAELHIEATEDTLHIYVPRDSVRQDICFLYNLPYALYKWIMDDGDSTVGLRENEQAKRIISSILAANPSSLELLLEKEGIVELDFPEFPEEEAVEEYTLSAAEDMHYFSSDVVYTQSSDGRTSAYEQEPETPILSEEGDSATLVSEVDTSGAQTPVSSLYSPGLPPDKQVRTSENSSCDTSEVPPAVQPVDNSVPSSETTHSVPASPEAKNTPPSPETVRASASSPEPLLFSQPPTPVPSRPGTPKIRDELDTPKGSAYISLLDTIINAARVASIPEKGTFDMSAMRVKLNEVHSTGNINEDYFKLRTTRAIERDKMIGAAGELYVFEMLSNKKMGLSFPRTRWQSIIRTYVTVHSDYADMGPWTGIETADFVYTDFDSDLTQILIDGGYLDQEVWKGQAPTYYIDVKTTMGGCETPFFMSKSQCKRMRTKSNGPDGKERQDSIYVVFRVFNLGKKSMGCSIYVDPDAMRVQGTLNFRAETWSVVPRPSA